MTYTPPEGLTIGSFTADTLPASFSAPAGAGISYKIYGTEAGVGVETESGETAGYKIPILNTSGVTENKFDKNTVTEDYYVSNNTGALLPATSMVTDVNVSDYIDVSGQESIYITRLDSTAIQQWGAFYDNNKIFLEGFTKYNRAVTIPSEAKYVRITVADAYLDNLMVTDGSTAPDHYVPHRYTSNYDLFIGDTQLYADEYVDYTTQKIYKLQEGVLIPTDPPLPLPSIITYGGVNTISSTETLGDVELTGEWSAIMGSTEDESIDIEFTVDAEEYIAFVTVDDDPSIQVSDTITMPASASSFTLQVVSWGREQYTDTVYNALS